MLTATACPQCHAELPADAPQGLCPKCLLRRIMETESDADAVDGELGMAVTNMPAVQRPTRSKTPPPRPVEPTRKNWTPIILAVAVVIVAAIAALFLRR